MEDLKAVVMEKFLKDNGFVKADIAAFWERGTEYYMLRIHDLTWVLYNLTDGFVTLRRKDENKRQGHVTELQAKNDTHDVMLPKPYRTVKDLKELLEVISDNTFVVGFEHHKCKERKQHALL